MSKQVLAGFTLSLMIVFGSSCQKGSSGHPGAASPITQPVEPPVPGIVDPPKPALTEEDCKSKLDDLLNHQDPAKIVSLSASLRNTAFLVALAVQGGKLESGCLDFIYTEEAAISP